MPMVMQVAKVLQEVLIGDSLLYLNSDHFFPLKKLSMLAVKDLGSTLSSIIIGLIIFGLPPPVIKFHT